MKRIKNIEFANFSEIMRTIIGNQNTKSCQFTEKKSYKKIIQENKIGPKFCSVLSDVFFIQGDKSHQFCGPRMSKILYLYLRKYWISKNKIV